MKNYLLLVALLIFGPSLVQAQLDMSVEIRPRAEVRHGFKTLFPDDVDAAKFIGQRSRLSLGLNKKNVTAFFSVQDVRTWGDVSTLNENTASTSIHEAWARFGLFKNIDLKMGRQEIAYDDERLFGAVNWANQARSHDAAVLIYEDSLWSSHLGLAFNQDGPSLIGTDYTINNYKTFQYFWYNRTIGKANFSLLLLNLGFQENGESGTIYQQTIGTNIKVPTSVADLHGAVYYQLGENVAENNISAYDIAFDATFKVGGFSLIPGVEILSGNDGETEDMEAFTPYFGTNHKFNGHMDYFFVGNHIGNVGLNDYYFKVKKKFKKVGAGLDFHYFAANTEIAPDVDAGLGTELDFYMSFPLKDAAKFKLGYSQLFATESMEVLKNGTADNMNSFAYLMIIVKPGFRLKE